MFGLAGVAGKLRSLLRLLRAATPRRLVLKKRRFIGFGMSFLGGLIRFLVFTVLHFSIHPFVNVLCDLSLVAGEKSCDIEVFR